MPIEPGRIAYWEALSFSVLFGCTFLYKLAHNHRFLLGLVLEDSQSAPAATRRVSLYRSQLLLVSLVLFSRVLYEALSAIVGKGTGVMPQVSMRDVTIFGASATLYAVGKMIRTLNKQHRAR